MEKLLGFRNMQEKLEKICTTHFRFEETAKEIGIFLQILRYFAIIRKRLLILQSFFFLFPGKNETFLL